MTRFLAIALFAVVLGGILGCGGAKTTVKGAEVLAPGAEVRVFEVFGMGCPGCEGGLCKLAKNIDGVSGANADWDDQRLRVTIAPGMSVDDAAIVDAIKRANLTPGKRLQ